MLKIWLCLAFLGLSLPIFAKPPVPTSTASVSARWTALNNDQVYFIARVAKQPSHPDSVTIDEAERLVAQIFGEPSPVFEQTIMDHLVDERIGNTLTRAGMQFYYAKDTTRAAALSLRIRSWIYKRFQLLDTRGSAPREIVKARQTLKQLLDDLDAIDARFQGTTVLRALGQCESYLRLKLTPTSGRLLDRKI